MTVFVGIFGMFSSIPRGPMCEKRKTYTKRVQNVNIDRRAYRYANQPEKNKILSLQKYNFVFFILQKTSFTARNSLDHHQERSL